MYEIHLYKAFRLTAVLLFYMKFISTLSYQMVEYLFYMKTLPFERDEKKNQVLVSCADGDVSVYSHCAYCRYCKGVWVGKRLTPTPQQQALNDIRKGSATDDNLMNAAMLFNTLIRDGLAIECEDDANKGFAGMYQGS